MTAIVGTIHKILPMASGVKKDGTTWRSQILVVKISNYSYLAATAWGDFVDKLKNVKEGWDIEMEISVSSREWSGKWYTECKINKLNFPTLFEDVPPEAVGEEPPMNDDQNDGLPF